VDLKVSADGSLYYLARGSSAVFRVQFLDPMLISEVGSDTAIALDSVTFIRDPFPLTDLFNFSADKRTRLMLFGMNMQLMAGENSSAVTARAEDAALNVYPLTVEFVGQVPGFDWLTQIVARLPDNTPTGQTLFVSATLRGKTTNKVRVRVQ
jgi:hypothetical protein